MVVSSVSPDLWETKGTCTHKQPTHYYLDKSTIICLDDEGKEEEYQMYKTCYESCNNYTNFKNETSMNLKQMITVMIILIINLVMLIQNVIMIQQFQIIIIIIVV